MFGPILVFAVAVVIVATYIFIVNRFLRSDEHWNENGQALAPATRERPVTITIIPGPRAASFTANRA